MLVANLFEIGGEVQHTSQVLYAVDEGLRILYMAEMSCSQLLLIGSAMCEPIKINSLVVQHSNEPLPPGTSCTGICFSITMFQYCICMVIVLTVILVLGLGLVFAIILYFVIST